MVAELIKEIRAELAEAKKNAESVKESASKINEVLSGFRTSDK